MLLNADTVECNGTTDAPFVDHRGMVSPNANSALSDFIAEDNVASYSGAFGVYRQHTDDDGAERALFVVTGRRNR